MKKIKELIFTETAFWLLWMLVCFIGWWIWKPIMWGVLVPMIRSFFCDWKKENDRINKELEKVP